MTQGLSVATLEGHFTSLHPALSTTLGWFEDEMRGKPLLDFVHPDDHAATRAASAELVRGHAQMFFENRYRHRDGSCRWLSWNAVPRGGLVYSAVRDVIEAKAAAEALAAHPRQLFCKDGTCLLEADCYIKRSA
ncbi:PAS domain-containing protein [Methylobacterium sp. J-092]|uniref:PAS domain-containing protein n=1 Tax=Methylobacterium sp. J-092 TaxID=2836667 RepID=UPI0028C43E6B|nr:PAS domain-containing protein [Methylobacterium sp. J-092]